MTPGVFFKLEIQMFEEQCVDLVQRPAVYLSGYLPLRRKLWAKLRRSLQLFLSLLGDSRPKHWLVTNRI